MSDHTVITTFQASLEGSSCWRRNSEGDGKLVLTVPETEAGNLEGAVYSKLKGRSFHVVITVKDEE